MVTKKIFKVVDNNNYTTAYCKQLNTNISAHLEQIHEIISPQETHLLIDGGVLWLVFSTIFDGKAEVDLEELKRRNTKEDVKETIKEFIEVGKLSKEYKKNRQKYLEV